MLVPPGWPGKGPIVALGIPECELHVVFVSPSGEPVAMINQPKINRNVENWLRTAAGIAANYKAAFVLSCDTAEQAAQATKKAKRLLPSYQRVPLERFYDADARVRGKLS